MNLPHNLTSTKKKKKKNQKDNSLAVKLVTRVKKKKKNSLSTQGKHRFLARAEIRQCKNATQTWHWRKILIRDKWLSVSFANTAFLLVCKQTHYTSCFLFPTFAYLLPSWWVTQSVLTPSYASTKKKKGWACTLWWAFTVACAERRAASALAGGMDSGSSHSFSVQSWLPDTTKAFFNLDQGTQAGTQSTPGITGGFTIQNNDTKTAQQSDNGFRSFYKMTLISSLK